MAAHISLAALLLLLFTLHRETRAGLSSKPLPKNSKIFINCGGSGGEGLISDAGFFKGYTHSFATNRSVKAYDSWGQAYKDAMTTHRWAWKGDLEYSIPVNGMYNVTLYFAETWDGAAGLGKRAFTVTINGMKAHIGGSWEFDVFKLASKAYKTFGVKTTRLVKSVEGAIRIKLGRVEGKNNPMISAILLTPKSSSE